MKADDTNLIVEFQTEDKKYVPAKYREAVIDKIYAHIYIYIHVHPSLYSHHVSCTCIHILIYIYICISSICIVLYLRILYCAHANLGENSWDCWLWLPSRHPAYKLPTWAKLRNKSHLPLAGSTCIFLIEKNSHPMLGPHSDVWEVEKFGKLKLADGSETTVDGWNPAPVEVGSLS